MKTLLIHFILALCSIQLLSAQDYEHSLEGIDKVVIISDVTVVLNTHKSSNFLISSQENTLINSNAKGLKPTFGKDNTGFNVFVEKMNSTLKVESYQPRTADDLILYLPENMAVSAEIRNNNDVIIYDFTNEIEAKTNNGDVKIEHVNGPVIIENENGNTFIIFDEVNQNSPISIVNSHGDIDITLPANTRASLEVYVPRGELFTDLDLVTVEKVEKNEDGKMRKTRNITSKMNDGGVSIVLVASRGNVYLRQK